MSRVTEARTFADKVKDFMDGKCKINYKIYDENNKKHKKVLI